MSCVAGGDDLFAMFRIGDHALKHGQCRSALPFPLNISPYDHLVVVPGIVVKRSRKIALDARLCYKIIYFP